MHGLFTFLAFWCPTFLWVRPSFPYILTICIHTFYPHLQVNPFSDGPNMNVVWEGYGVVTFGETVLLSSKIRLPMNFTHMMPMLLKASIFISYSLCLRPPHYVCLRICRDHRPEDCSHKVLCYIHFGRHLAAGCQHGRLRL